MAVGHDQEMAPTVVLLHGFTHTGASWDPIIEALGQSYRAVAPDLPGHGRAQAAAPDSLEAIRAELPRSDFILVGYSMGGRIALHLALAVPERVNRLVLIGASPGIAHPAERAERRRSDERLADEFEQLDIESLAGHWARTPVLAGQPAHVQTAAHADRLRSTPHGLASALRYLGTGALPPLWDRLDKLTMPVSLIVGERDQKFRTIAAEMAARLPHGRVEVIPGSGHAVHLEEPEAVAAAIAGRGGFRS
jgi:2-succinyl-6-hydroxy-2,4-cyclohexadiene-1-carboxylate synthase